MADRLRALLPRIAAIVLLGLAATAALSYAAGRNIDPTHPVTSTTAAKPQPLVVPNLVGQAFVFAKGTLEDGGFAWRVAGGVHGYPANTVASQSPAGGTKVLNTGAPLITLTLKRNAGYPQTGQAEDASPYAGTAIEQADAVAKPTTTTAPKPKAKAQPKAQAQPTPNAQPTTKWPQNRPPAFTVRGAKKEPLDEMPLPDRAQLLSKWLAAHPKKTRANVAHWLYQNEWIVTGAKFGWWHGAQALTTLVAVDRRAVALWGIGGKSALLAQNALSEVQSRSK